MSGDRYAMMEVEAIGLFVLGFLIELGFAIAGVHGVLGNSIGVGLGWLEGMCIGSVSHNICQRGWMIILKRKSWLARAGKREGIS